MYRYTRARGTVEVDGGLAGGNKVFVDMEKARRREKTVKRLTKGDALL